MPLLSEDIMAPETVKDLQDKIRLLEGELKASEEKRITSEEIQKEFAQAAQFSSGGIDERPTGKTRTIKRCINPWERDKDELEWETFIVPTYFYTVKLPVGAGLDITVNGIKYYHGETYTFDLYELRDIKSMVARTWDHEKSIHGDNENAYRRPTEKFVR